MSVVRTAHRLRQAAPRIVAIPLKVWGPPAHTAHSPNKPHDSQIHALSISRSHDGFMKPKSSSTFYHFQLNDPAKTPSAQDRAVLAPSAGRTKAGSWLRTRPAWAEAKVAAMWSSFGRAEGGWRMKVFKFGERLMEVDFEEMALKSIDITLGPSLSHPVTNPLARFLKPANAAPLKISLLYPPSVMTAETSLAQLQHTVDVRTPLHKKGMYMWLAIMPFTFPLKLIPIIPNLPFFFCAWRAWSHYKAYKASTYLQSVLGEGMIEPHASHALDMLYQGQSTGCGARLLDESAFPEVVELLELEGEERVRVEADLRRAVSQAQKRNGGG